MTRYIKEFVHGDFGRTKPNLCVLLEAETDILELDVEVGYRDISNTHVNQHCSIIWAKNGGGGHSLEHFRAQPLVGCLGLGKLTFEMSLSNLNGSKSISMIHIGPDV